MGAKNSRKTSYFCTRAARVESFRQFLKHLVAQWYLMQGSDSSSRQAFQNDLWVFENPLCSLMSFLWWRGWSELGALAVSPHLFLTCNESLRIQLRQHSWKVRMNDVEFSMAMWLFVFLCTAGFNNSRNSLAPVKGLLNHTAACWFWQHPFLLQGAGV